MYRIKRVVICDLCDRVEIPPRWEPGNFTRTLPDFWEKRGALDLCPSCAALLNQYDLERGDTDERDWTEG